MICQDCKQGNHNLCAYDCYCQHRVLNNEVPQEVQKTERLPKPSKLRKLLRIENIKIG